MGLFIFSLLIVTLFATQLSATPLTVTPITGSQNTVTELTLKVSSHRWVAGGPCGRDDYECMNSYALKYVNEIRKNDKGYAAYDMGTVSMLNNAITHTRAMQAAGGKPYHQNLKTTPLGCNSFFSGENVGQDFIPFSPTVVSDPAKICVEGFKNSPPHYQNIISTYHTATVMGVVVAPNDYVWCTQLFVKNTVYASGTCARAKNMLGNTGSGTSSPADSTPPSAASGQGSTTNGQGSTTNGQGSTMNGQGSTTNGQMKTSSGHVFKNLSFNGRLSNGSVAVFAVQCEAGKCYYCAKAIDFCLSEGYSITIDNMIG